MLLQKTHAESLPVPGFQCYYNLARGGCSWQAILITAQLHHGIIDMLEWNTLEVQVCVEGAKWNIINTYVLNNSLKDEEQWKFLYELDELPGRRG